MPFSPHSQGSRGASDREETTSSNSYVEVCQEECPPLASTAASLRPNGFSQIPVDQFRAVRRMATTRRACRDLTRATRAGTPCHHDHVRRRSSLAATIALVVGVGAGVSLGPVGASAVASAAKKAPPMKPPVITESFTLLPCNKGSTIGTEGCEEHQLVTADKRIDREVSVLFALLHDDAARSRLVRARRTSMRAGQSRRW